MNIVIDKFKYFSFAALLPVLLHTCVTLATQELKWEPLYGGDAATILQHAIPAGVVMNRAEKIFICRAWHNKRWVPGRFYIWKGWRGTCIITESGAVKEFTEGDGNVQVLISPPGWTSWVPLSDRFCVPNNSIKGGNHSNGDAAYICRSTHGNGNLIPGTYSQLLGECIYELWGIHRGSSEVEILVMNQYGKIMEDATTMQMQLQTSTPTNIIIHNGLKK